MRTGIRCSCQQAGGDAVPEGKAFGPVSCGVSDRLPSGFRAAYTEEELRTFHPAVCNRLDRNTSGIVAAGKTLAALQDAERHVPGAEC